MRRPPKDMEGHRSRSELNSRESELKKNTRFPPLEYPRRRTEGDPIKPKEIGSLPKEMEGEPNEIIT